MKTLGVAREAARRFRGDPWLGGYCLGKSILDPAYAFLAVRLLAAGRPVLDIGCGAGAFAAYLRACGFRGAIRGLDPDSAKVRAAGRAVPDGDFTTGDAGSLPPHTGDVVALDVLHYIAPERRADFFRAVAARLGNEGRGYVRTTLRDGSWRCAVTRLEEFFVRASGWIPYRSDRFPSRAEIERDTAGLTCRIIPMYGRTPFNSHLIEISNTARLRGPKRASEAAAPALNHRSGICTA